MKLLLNTESLAPPLTGIGNYTFNLLRELQHSDIETIECFSGGNSCSASEALQRCLAASAGYAQRKDAPASLKSRLITLLRSSATAYKVREWLRDAQLQSQAGRRKDFVYHEPNFILKRHSGPCVTTIHDLSFIHHPEFHPPKRVAWLTSQLPKTLARADFVITDSEQIRNELIDDFKVSADRVRSIYLGASSAFEPMDAARTRAILTQHGLQHGQYLLFVGTLEPRKGVDTLLDAWQALPAPLREQFPLVLAGAPGWQNRALNERVAQLQASHGLRHLRFVSDQELPTLYAGAGLFAYPSLYEGFGLPVLEAMSCGVPVVCTAGTSMAEFTQGSAALFENGNARSLGERIEQLLVNDRARADLAAAGLLRSRDFSWRTCAEQTQAVYRMVSR